MFHILIFFTVLLIFLHVRKHRITSNDMEVLLLNGANLETLCEFKQPILFQINETEKLLECKFEKNYDMEMIKENGLLPLFETNFLSPAFSYPEYSILLSASEDYMYHISFRQYFLLSQGSATVHLIPPNFMPVSNRDYYDMKFSYNGDIDLEKILPIELKQYDCLFIPPLWGYKLILNEKTSILSFNYKTPLNILSFSDYYILHFLQKMNTTYKVSKKIENKLEDKEEKKEDKAKKE